MRVANSWKDYVVIATGDGEKLEKWGGFTLLRPDPQVIWHKKTNLKKVLMLFTNAKMVADFGTITKLCQKNGKYLGKI